MTPFPLRLQRRLENNDWDIVEVIKAEDWWADEHWRVRSRRTPRELELILSFLVDPMWDGPRARGQAVWSVTVTGSIPLVRPVGDEAQIASLSVREARADEKLVAFVRALDEYRAAWSSGAIENK